MTLVRMNRRDPARTWSHVFDDFDRLFNGFSTPTQVQAGANSIDLYETDEALVLEMAVPGVTSEGVDISIEGRQLSLRTRFADEAEEGAENRRYWLQGVPRGEVSRTLRLPASVDVDAIEARVRDGMLTLRMPKMAEAKVKKIEVASS